MGAGYGSAREAKRRKRSTTAGRTKSANCQATPLQRGMARHGRAYRWSPQAYSEFCQQKDGGMGKRSAGIDF